MTRGLDVHGQLRTLEGHRIYVEMSGRGPAKVVFESGLGFGRTCWDPLIPLLQDDARLVTYDRPGHGRSEPDGGPTTLGEMATTLRALVDATGSGPLVLVAHSMGGLIAREAVPSLGSRLVGVLLLDPTPETADMYDNVERSTRQQDLLLGVFQAMSRVRPLRRFVAAIGAGGFRRSFSPVTDAAIREEDFLPSSFARMRAETAARTAAVLAFRHEPPLPPGCPLILLSASRVARGGGGYLADIQEHQRRYVETLEHGRFEVVDSTHLVMADQPALVADRIRELLSAAGSDRGA